MKTIEEEFLNGSTPQEFIKGSYAEFEQERINLLNVIRLLDKKLEEIRALVK